MSKIFNLSYCTTDLRHYFQPLSTTEELFRLKTYRIYQKQLALRLINYQRLITSKYNRKIIRLTPICLNSIESVIDENSIHKSSIDSPLEHKSSDNAIKRINIPILKIKTCSTLIATGHGIAKKISSIIDINTEQLNYTTIDEDISLSKTCRKINLNKF